MSLTKIILKNRGVCLITGCPLYWAYFRKMLFHQYSGSQHVDLIPILDGLDSRNDIRFDCEGNRDGRYGIYKLEGSPLDGGTEYVKIGYWADSTITLNASEVEKLAISNCTPECRKNEYRDMDDNVSMM